MAFRCTNILVSWSIQYIYSGNRFKQISGNALDLREKALPVGNHGQLGLGELLEVHHDDLLEVGHPVVLEQLHLHLGVWVKMRFKSFEDREITLITSDIFWKVS